MAQAPSDWWMYHGDPAHSGLATGSAITSANVGTGLKTLHDVELDGPILSTPALAGGFAYVGTANSHDAATGDVSWIFCTCQFQADVANRPNQLPAELLNGPPPAGFTAFDGTPVCTGCSVWAGIAYDERLNRLYCSTGNPQPDSGLPSAGYSNGLLVLDAGTGAFVGCVQFPPESSYRTTDVDVDVGGGPTLFTDAQGKRRVGLGCKNGSYMVLDADTLERLALRQMLPFYQGGGQIPTVDPHSNSPAMN